jgi:hypothetical protein
MRHVSTSARADLLRADPRALTRTACLVTLAACVLTVLCAITADAASASAAGPRGHQAAAKRCAHGKVLTRVDGHRRCVRPLREPADAPPRPPATQTSVTAADPAGGCGQGVLCSLDSVTPDPGNGPVITGPNPDGSVSTGCAPDTYVLAFYYWRGLESQAWYNPCQKAYGQWSAWEFNQADWDRWHDSWENYSTGVPLRWSDYH